MRVRPDIVLDVLGDTTLLNNVTENTMGIKTRYYRDLGLMCLLPSTEGLDIKLRLHYLFYN